MTADRSPARPRSKQLPEGVSSEAMLARPLRVECRERGFSVDHITDLALGYVLAAVGNDVPLAADALAMSPRAAWVEEFCGV